MQYSTSGAPTSDSQRPVRGAGVGTATHVAPSPALAGGTSSAWTRTTEPPLVRAMASTSAVVRAAGPVPSSTSIAFVNAEGATTWAFS